MEDLISKMNEEKFTFNDDPKSFLFPTIEDTSPEKVSTQVNSADSQIFGNEINMMIQNVHSLRSINQAINLDAIIDIMISKKN